jgi:hypothetical protein
MDMVDLGLLLSMLGRWDKYLVPDSVQELAHGTLRFHCSASQDNW